MTRGRDIAGQRFGALVALNREVKSKNGTWKWRVACDCGHQEIVFITVLTSGRKVCCLECFPARQSRAKTKHGMSRSTEYAVWKGMKARCENKNHDAYDRYGGRGIKYCLRWKKFDNFLADMGPRPSGFTLERTNNARGYEPGNCRCASPKDQANNRRDNHMLTIGGETMTISQWAEKTGVNRTTINYRLNAGYSPEEAIK